jgi:uncharacterized membrane protein HdeD (DUF308 family)
LTKEGEVKSIKRAVGKTACDSFGIVCITAGVNSILAGNYVIGTFLIVVGLASLFAEHYLS